MRLSFFIMLIGLASTPNLYKGETSIEGSWRSEVDEHYIVKFTHDKFYEIYDRDTSIYHYSRSSKFCDEKYLKDTIADVDFFSLDDGRCFEITGLTDSSLSYRNTVNAKLQVFRKLQ